MADSVGFRPVSQLLDMYMERHAKFKHSPKTREGEFSFGRQLVRVLGNPLLPDVTLSALEGYLAKRRDEGVSDVTIHHELKLLKHAFMFAVKRWDLIDKTPFDKFDLPKGDNKRVRYLNPDEVTALFGALVSCGKEWLLSAVIVARETGLRRSNVCALTWKQCNFAHRVIEIERTKNGNPVSIPMTPNVEAVLLKLGKIRDLTSDRVFRVNGKPLLPDYLSRSFQEVCTQAGIVDFRFHDLRHDFCSILVQNGVPLEVVAELAGHMDISMTRRYAHMNLAVKRKGLDSAFGYIPAIVEQQGVAG